MKTKIIMTLITLGLIAFVVIVSLTSNSSEGDHPTIEDIVFEEGVVNIYYFWQYGCPHCDAQFEFLERIEAEWGAYFTVYAFEVASNRDNARLLNEVAGLLDTHVGGIPFTIIGEQTFTGFTERMEDGFINAIRNGRNHDFDVFRDLVEQ